jgi:hypothetical protein
MTPPKLTLSVLPGTYAVCRLEPEAPIPEWAASTAFCSITRTADEVSIVCPEALVPRDIQTVSGWKTLKVHGPLAFTQTGVLASLARPLAEAGISVLAISTYDTDYLVVKQGTLEAALAVLTAQGHQIA